MTVRYYSSTAAETQLTGTINNVATSITIASAVGLPASTPFTLALDYEGASEELVEVTSLAGTTATIVRAIDGTAATGHTTGARVRHVSSARDFADSREHENATDGVHGLAPGVVIVGTTTAQSLTNKSISSSTWSGGTIGGTIAGTPTFTGAVGLTGGGTLAGTFAGTHTYSGTVTHTGATNFSNTATTTALVQSNRTNATDVVLGVLYGAFVNDTFRLLANGRMEWGPGSGARDTFMYRSLAGELTIDANLIADNVSTGAVSATSATISGTATANTVSAATVTNSTLGMDYKPVQAGSTLINFTAQTSWTEAVVFPTSFSGQPRMSCNIASGSGNAARWGARAINVTSTGFTIFVFRGDNTDPAETWTNIPVHWIAVSQ